MQIPNYETKVPESIRAENTEKVAGYDNELTAQAKSLEEMKKLL